MLDAIEEVHNRGFIHRDVKAVSIHRVGSDKVIVELRTVEGQQIGVHRGLWAGQETSDGRLQNPCANKKEG